MNSVTINCDKILGKIKPMHCVNNGPLMTERPTRNNYESFKALKIPYARTHDTNLGGLGGWHKCDISQIFPDFDADVNDPNSYDFFLTDQYLEFVLSTGTQIFFRLGESIEHDAKKYRVHPPKDFHKWAEICEHVIMHFNEGWADGHHWGIEYFEIWNEPNLESQAMWTGTMEQFYDFYCVASKHLKSKFPHLKIGGPAFTNVWEDDPRLLNFLKMIRDENVPIDFFSWHKYGSDIIHDNISGLGARIKASVEVLAQFGLDKIENIINEYNFVYNWQDRYAESFAAIQGVIGAAYIASVFLYCQDTPISMLMYYDARPCAFNGIWDYYTLSPNHTYYVFEYFSRLYELGKQVEAKVNGKDIYAVGATNGKDNALMISSYNLGKSPSYSRKKVEIDLGDKVKKVKISFTSEKNKKQVYERSVENGKLDLIVPSVSFALIEW